MSNLSKKAGRKIARFLNRIFNAGVPLKLVLILLVIFTASAVGITYSKVVRDVGGKSEYEEAMLYISLKNLIDENYIGEVDRDSLADSSTAAMVSGLSDKWSYYMTADEYKTYQLFSSNEYSSIGISLETCDDGFTVTAVNYDSPAAKAGLTAGMVITSVDGQKVSGMNADDVRELIRSKLNTSFVLGIGNHDQITVDCTSTYVTSVNYRLEKTMAGYVQIADFEAGSAEDSIAAMKYLLSQEAEAFVIDLRGNSGGLYTEAEKLLDYILPNYTLFYKVDKAGNKTEYSSDGYCIDMPICVLVNSGTYGCAEIFAAVMQEYSWATILGEPTTGNVRGQETFELDDGSAIRLSTSTYITAAGTDISNRGVTPDVITYNSDASTVGTTQGTTGGEEGTSSTSADEQLMAALKYLS